MHLAIVRWQRCPKKSRLVQGRCAPKSWQHTQRVRRDHTNKCITQNSQQELGIHMAVTYDGDPSTNFIPSSLVLFIVQNVRVCRKRSDSSSSLVSQDLRECFDGIQTLPDVPFNS